MGDLWDWGAARLGARLLEMGAPRAHLLRALANVHTTRRLSRRRVDGQLIAWGAARQARVPRPRSWGTDPHWTDLETPFRKAEPRAQGSRVAELWLHCMGLTWSCREAPAQCPVFPVHWACVCTRVCAGTGPPLQDSRQSRSHRQGPRVFL